MNEEERNHLFQLNWPGNPAPQPLVSLDSPCPHRYGPGHIWVPGPESFVICDLCEQSAEEAEGEPPSWHCGRCGIELNFGEQCPCRDRNS